MKLIYQFIAAIYAFGPTGVMASFIPSTKDPSIHTILLETSRKLDESIGDVDVYDDSDDFVTEIKNGTYGFENKLQSVLEKTILLEFGLKKTIAAHEANEANGASVSRKKC